MKNQTVQDFSSQLPNNLQEKYSGLIKANLGAVIKKYQGPEYLCENTDGCEILAPFFGVQEIKFEIEVPENSISEVRKRWHSLFFDEETGEFLSSTMNEAIKLDFEHVLTCNNNDDEISIATKCLKSSIVDEETKIATTESLHPTSSFDIAHQLWLEAWKAEDEGHAKEAREKFTKSNEFFTKASQLEGENSEIKKFIEISNLKIEGNNLFNEAVNLQKEANKFHEKYLFQEARNKFQEAIGKFQQGYEASGHDLKFKACGDFIETSIQNINLAIRKIQLNTGSGIQHSKYFDDFLD